MPIEGLRPEKSGLFDCGHSETLEKVSSVTDSSSINRHHHRVQAKLHGTARLTCMPFRSILSVNQALLIGLHCEPDCLVMSKISWSREHSEMNAQLRPISRQVLVTEDRISYINRSLARIVSAIPIKARPVPLSLSAAFDTTLDSS